MDETAKRAHPKEEGGVRRRRRGMKEAVDMRKRRRFREKTRRFGREQKSLRLEELVAIFVRIVEAEGYLLWILSGSVI